MVSTEALVSFPAARTVLPPAPVCGGRPLFVSTNPANCVQTARLKTEGQKISEYKEMERKNDGALNEEGR